MTRPVYGEQEISRDMLAAIGRARLAPSVHNTQPWLFHLTSSGIDLLSDSSRRLTALDSDGREFTLSCGAALLHLRLALRAEGYVPETVMFPDAGRDDVLARVAPGVKGRPDPFAQRLDQLAESRSTNRHGYHGAVSTSDLEELQAAAETEGAGVQLVEDETDRVRVKVWQQAANAKQLGSRAYRRELRSWVNNGHHDDGVDVASTVEPAGRPHDFAPRDFAFDQLGGMAEETDDRDTKLLILFTEEDSPASWLEAGQALARLWLEATRLGLVMQPLSQSVEDPVIRLAMRSGLRLMSCWPQLLIRVGRAPLQQASARRAVGDITQIDADVSGAERVPAPARAALVAHRT